MKVFANLRAALVLARSLKRIADALEQQNHIRKIELQEIHGISVPDPMRKWTKTELETEVSYESVPVGVEPEESEIDEWNDIFKDK